METVGTDKIRVDVETWSREYAAGYEYYYINNDERIKYRKLFNIKGIA